MSGLGMTGASYSPRSASEVSRRMRRAEYTHLRDGRGVLGRGGGSSLLRLLLAERQTTKEAVVMLVM